WGSLLKAALTVEQHGSWSTWRDSCSFSRSPISCMPSTWMYIAQVPDGSQYSSVLLLLDSSSVPLVCLFCHLNGTRFGFPFLAFWYLWWLRSSLARTVFPLGIRASVVPTKRNQGFVVAVFDDLPGFHHQNPVGFAGLI